VAGGGALKPPCISIPQYTTTQVGGPCLTIHIPPLVQTCLKIKIKISKSELGYFRRVKDKVAKQLVKNKEMLAEVVIDTPEEGVKEYSKEVYNSMKMASVVGMTWAGDDTKMLDMFSARERKAKGMRELKNLDCSVSLVKSQRRRGRVGSKNDISFPPEIH
jgi:hypothetical protein